MFCRNCGKELIGSPEICPSCGARPMRGNSFCSNCGAPTTPLTEICPKCGAWVIGGERQFKSIRDEDLDKFVKKYPPYKFFQEIKQCLGLK